MSEEQPCVDNTFLFGEVAGTAVFPEGAHICVNPFVETLQLVIVQNAMLEENVANTYAVMVLTNLSV